MASVHGTEIHGAYVVEPVVHRDPRECFVETYRRSWIPEAREMIQSNRADRVAGCVVGLHYHLHQSDYWYVPAGRCRVVMHDLRVGSPTDGHTVVLDIGGDGGPDHDHRGIYIPPGVAHGFYSLTDMTITYMVDGHYNPADELGVAWNDPAIGADWGTTDPVLSERDAANPTRDTIADRLRPHAPLRT